jgi:hypothetical protein
MFKQTLKRMVLTGATVMVLMSTAAPAIAAPNVEDQDHETVIPWCWILGTQCGVE